MKRIRPSGAQQRKKQKAKALELQSLAGSLLKFVTPSSSASTSSIPEESNFCGDVRENTETISQSKGQGEVDFEENGVLSDSDSFESEEQTETEMDNQSEVYQNKDAETEKRRDILKRLLAVTLFLAEGNLPLHGHGEHTGVLSGNKGNFLEFLELLSKYDPVLRDQFIKVEEAGQSQAGKILLSYLSPNVQNEFITLLGESVKKNILLDVKEAKYYCIIFDSTADIGQMCEIVRYVHIENKKVEVRESFLGCFQVDGRKAPDITEDIIKAIKKDGLDITLCQGMGYDNVSSTMASVQSGVQAKMHELHPKALFVPCTNNSLGLCAELSFGADLNCGAFFLTLDSLYCFFSASTDRWTALVTNVGVTVQRLSDTRWRGHLEAVKLVRANFTKIVDALEELGDPKESFETKTKALPLLEAVCDFYFLCFLSLWSNVLEEVSRTQNYLQNVGISFEECALKMRSLKIFLKDNRNEMVETALQFATSTCEEMEIPLVKRITVRKRKRMLGEKAQDEEPLTLNEELRRSMLECVNRFYQEMDTRCKDMESISARFAVLESKNLITASEDELPQLIQNLVVNCDELSEDGILQEIPRLRRHLQAAKVPKEDSLEWSPLRFLEFVVEYELSDSVPNLTVAFRILLTLCLSVASSVRSFSKLKLIKSYFSSAMSQAELPGLAILSIEKKIAKGIDFDDVISKFAEVPRCYQ